MLEAAAIVGWWVSIGSIHWCPAPVQVESWYSSIYLPYANVYRVEIIPCLVFVLLNKVILKIFGKVEVHLELPELEMESLMVHFT